MDEKQRAFDTKEIWPSKDLLNDPDRLLILKISLISISESFDRVEASTKSKIVVQDVLRR